MSARRCGQCRSTRPKVPLEVLVEHEVLAHQADRLDRVVLELAGAADRLPVAAQQIAHRRAGADAGEQFVAGCGEHMSSNGIVPPLCCPRAGGKAAQLDRGTKTPCHVLWPGRRRDAQSWAGRKPRRKCLGGLSAQGGRRANSILISRPAQGKFAGFSACRVSSASHRLLVAPRRPQNPRSVCGWPAGGGHAAAAHRVRHRRRLSQPHAGAGRRLRTRDRRSCAPRGSCSTPRCGASRWRSRSWPTPRRCSATISWASAPTPQPFSKIIPASRSRSPPAMAGNYEHQHPRRRTLPPRINRRSIEAVFSTGKPDYPTCSSAR